MEIISRSEAKARGLTKYFTGKPCVHGHTAQRSITSFGCSVCMTERRKLREQRPDVKKRRNEYVKARHAARGGVTEKQRISHREYQRKRNNLPQPTRPCPAVCELCGKPEMKSKRSLALDHCHATGAFRGWLCFNCNVCLARLCGDTVEGAERVVRYLKTREPQFTKVWEGING